jgi:tellurite resistance protein TehA-like permease
MVTRTKTHAHQPGNEDGYDLSIPWTLVDTHPADSPTADTEQHKRRHGQHLRKRSIRHYRHATTRWGAALESFKPMWFAIAISTGGLATILNGPFPYPAVWQVTLASILYVFEIVLFAIFSVLLIARWILYPHVAIRRALADPDELGAYAIPPIALMTIAALTASQVSTAQWGGHAFTLVAYVFWWIGVTWTFLTALVVLTVFIYTGNQMDRVMTPVLFMAPVGLATAGVEAGFMTIFSAEMSSRLAVLMLVVGYFVVGIAFFMAIILYTIYFHRLLAAGWSAPATRGALFILVSAAYIGLQCSWANHVDRLVPRANYRLLSSYLESRHQATTVYHSISRSLSTHLCMGHFGANKPPKVSMVPAYSSAFCFSASTTYVLGWQLLA